MYLSRGRKSYLSTKYINAHIKIQLIHAVGGNQIKLFKLRKVYELNNNAQKYVTLSIRETFFIDKCMSTVSYSDKILTV